MRSPSRNKAVPAPVPSVRTISRPHPPISPSPCTSRVVQHTRRFSKPRGQGLGELKPLPRRRTKMRGGDNATATHKAREPNRSSVELRQWSDQPAENLEQGRGRIGLGSCDEDLIEHHATVRIENNSLQMRSADVNGERQRCLRRRRLRSCSTYGPSALLRPRPLAREAAWSQPTDRSSHSPAPVVAARSTKQCQCRDGQRLAAGKTAGLALPIVRNALPPRRFAA